MPYKTDTELDLRPRTTSRYLISSHHRGNGNKHKSIWTITRDQEVDCFILSRTSNWFCGTHYWGLRWTGTRLAIIGENNVSNELRFAKFVGTTKNDIWHGYPADYLAKKQDIPSLEILSLWKDEQYLNKSHIRKIRQQMPCNL